MFFNQRGPKCSDQISSVFMSKTGQAQRLAVAAGGPQQQQQQQPAGLLQQRPEQSGSLAAGFRGDG